MFQNCTHVSNCSFFAAAPLLAHPHKPFYFNNRKYLHSGPSSALDRCRSVISMGYSYSSSREYRIEISGWGLDNSFFAERADLLWTTQGEKQVQLHRALPEGAIVFIRLLSSGPSSGSVPVAYQVQDVLPMDCSGRCQMRLTQLHPRSKESQTGKTASDTLEDLRRVCDAQELEVELQHEEILL
jgi:hypothetical protein